MFQVTVLLMSFNTLPVNKANFRKLESLIGPVVSGLLATFLHNSTEKNGSSEDNSPSVCQQDILLQQPKLCYYNILQLLTYMDPVHTLTFHFLKISFNIIPPSLPGPPSDHLSCGFPQVKSVYKYNI
jgi:hypothetical protein